MSIPKLKPLSLEEWRRKIDGLERAKARAAKLQSLKTNKENKKEN
jgi:hypothetical protein